MLTTTRPCSSGWLNSSFVCMPELLGSSSGSSVLGSPSFSETTMQSSSDDMSIVAVAGGVLAGRIFYNSCQQSSNNKM